MEPDQLQEDEVFRCERCNSRTYRMVRFLARFWYSPWLRDLKVPMEIEVPICADCQRLELLPFVDITNFTAIEWLPKKEVIFPGTTPIYT